MSIGPQVSHTGMLDKIMHLLLSRVQGCREHIRYQPVDVVVLPSFPDVGINKDQTRTKLDLKGSWIGALKVSVVM